MRPNRSKGILLVTCAVLASAGASGCSLKVTAAKAVGNSLAAPGDVFTRDDDPELIRHAIPFALKTFESLLEVVPKHQPLLVAACSGFTSYSYGFVQTDADLLQFTDRPASRAANDRAMKMYLRAKGYCMRALDLRYPGLSKKLLADPDAALAITTRQDVELLYWTAASWGSAMSLGKDQPDLVIDFPIVRALANRALALDPEWSNGSIHELFITLDSQPEALGGSPEGARKHFAEAVRIQKGQLPGPYVELAEGQSIFNQDRAEFEKLMNQALALDPNVQPSVRVVSLVMQRRARGLLDHIDELFAK